MMSRSARVCAGLSLALAFLLAATSSWAGEAIDGKWELNVAKSKFDPGPPVKSQSRIYSTTGDMQTVKIHNVPAEGEPMMSEATYRLDGKAYAVKGSHDLDMIAMQKVNNLKAHGTGIKSGKVVSNITRTVSNDGKMLTVETKGTAANGQPFDNVLVFDRK